MLFWYKRYSLILIVCLVILQGCQDNVNDSSPQELGKAVYSSIKNNDREDFKKLFPNKKEGLDLIDQMSVDNTKKEELKHYWIGAHQVMKSQIQLYFDSYQKPDINWKNTDYLLTIGIIHEKSGVKTTDLRILIKDSSDIIMLRTDHCYKYERGWLMTEVPVVEGPVYK